MDKSKSRYFNTAMKMDEALLALLEKKDLAYITVKEICEKAGVNRSTFYLHYETIDDLICETIEYIYETFKSSMAAQNDFATKLKSCSTEELYLITPEYLLPYLEYIKEHKRIFKTVVENAAVLRLDDTYSRMFSAVFMPILERFNVPTQYMEYMMAYYIHGLMAVVSKWLENDCCETTEQMTELLLRLVMK